MKHIYIVLLLLLSCNIYAQEKELDIKKLAELVNSDEEFNQYFEDLSWVQSADSLNIYFETVTSNEATIYAIKNIGNPSVFLLTNKSKVALGWEKQIKKFEEDIKKGKNVKLEDYMDDNDKKYSNTFTDNTYQVSTRVNDYLKKSIEIIFSSVNNLVK